LFLRYFIGKHNLSFLREKNIEFGFFLDDKKEQRRFFNKEIEKYEGFSF